MPAIVAVLVAMVATAPIGGPALAEVSSNAEVTWGVYGLDGDTETDTIQSQVFAIEQIGRYIYVGGKFLEARPNSAGTPVAQPYLAAFDAGTGALVASFRPAVDGPVYSLQASPDGTRLFVGGEFTSIGDDREARGLAALDPLTGAVDRSWRAKVTDSSGAVGIVHSLTVSGQQLYLAGRFNRIGGGPRLLHPTEKVGRVSLSDGSPDPTLTTDIDGGAVWGIAVSPDTTRIYLAGYHDTVGGDAAGADFAVLDAADGRLIPHLSDVGGNSSSSSRWYGQDVVAVGDLVFWAGSEHIVRVFRASDGALLREHSTDRGGDFQDLELVGDRVYASCHCYNNHYADYDWWTRTNPIPATVAVTPIRYVAAYSALTGEHLPSFALDVSATRAGIWAIHGDPSGCLWIGGDVSRITTVAGNDRAAGGFAKFCSGDGGDNLAPDSPPNLVQTRSESRTIVIRWDAAYDNIGAAGFEVSREGQVVGTVASGWSAQYWFTDQGLEPATTYRYEVVTVDGAGNRSAPAAVEAATVGAAADTQAPTEPANLTQTRSELRKIVLRFDASSDDIGVDHYEVSRDGQVTGTAQASAANQYWYVDTGLTPATSYGYQVVAVDAAGNHSTPAAVTAGTVGAPAGEAVAAPTGLRSTQQTRERIVLNWTASAGAVAYVVQRDDGAGFADLATTTGVWHTDLHLVAGTTHTYRVLAVDGTGLRSEPSGALAVSTLP